MRAYTFITHFCFMFHFHVFETLEEPMLIWVPKIDLPKIGYTEVKSSLD